MGIEGQTPKNERLNITPEDQSVIEAVAAKVGEPGPEKVAVPAPHPGDENLHPVQSDEEKIADLKDGPFGHGLKPLQR
jgi:hypothetical protein